MRELLGSEQETGQFNLFLGGLPNTEAISVATVTTAQSWKRDSNTGSGVGLPVREYDFDCSALAFARMEVVRVRARGTVNQALRLGTLARPEACQSCGEHFPLESHHADYSRPLDVEWLCDLCHTRETKRLADLARSEIPKGKPIRIK